MQCERHQVQVVAPGTRLGDDNGVGERGVQIATGTDVHQHRRHQQVAALDAVAVLFGEQSLSPRRPAVGPGQLAPIEQTQTHPERAARGVDRRAAVEVTRMSAFERAEGVVITVDQICRHPELLEVRGREVAIEIRSRKLVKGLPPGPLTVGRSTTDQVAECSRARPASLRHGSILLRFGHDGSHMRTVRSRRIRSRWSRQYEAIGVRLNTVQVAAVDVAVARPGNRTGCVRDLPAGGRRA